MNSPCTEHCYLHHAFYSANFTARSTGFCRLLTVVAVKGFVLKQWHNEFHSLFVLDPKKKAITKNIV
jgi:hypothetical protein